MSGIHFKAVEVKGVSTDTDSTDSGVISGIYMLDDQNSVAQDEQLFLPLEPNVQQVPIKGEIVMGTLFLGKHYYTSKFNIRNSEKDNAIPGVSNYSQKDIEDFQLGKYYTPNEKSKKLVINEGDTILQGRFGNSIRLGSNQVVDFIEQNLDTDEKRYTDSPNIKLVAGMDTNLPEDSNFHYESLDQERSSIYLTTNEEIDFSFKDKTIISQEEPQITIQSDSIVFHGRNEFNVYSDSINLGDDENLENAVLGNKLIEVLEEIVETIENTDIGAGQATKPLPFVGKLKSIISDKILSKNVKLK